MDDEKRDLFSTDELYKFALVYFKENEGRNFHVQFDEKLELVALTQQANQGNIKNVELPPIGALDVIGKQRRSAWANLGDLDRQVAKQQFVDKLTRIENNFQQYLDEKTEQEKKKREEEAVQLQTKLEKEKLDKETSDQKQKEELERRKIKDALNKQTFQQFKSYAEQQYTDNPDQQAVLIKQLQEQHYHQYMQQLVQQNAAGNTPQLLQSQIAGNTTQLLQGQISGNTQQLLNGTITENHLCDHDEAVLSNGDVHNSAAFAHNLSPCVGACHEQGEEEGKEMVCLGDHSGHTDHQYELETNLSMMDINKSNIEDLDCEEANMWTRKEINDFKESIKKDESDAIIKVGHGETVTIRVPTHQDGKALYWEFATDYYDIGFGVFFEWVEPEDTQVTVHVSDSEDEDEDELFDEDGEGSAEARGVDPESGGKGYPVDNGPPTSCIVPIYRRDCHEEVYAGCHNYPSQGVYLLKFDNSYSLWRSKTLYYRVYYTR